MGVAADIRRSLTRGPRQVIREHLARGESEAHALALLMLGCGLVFLGQWPRLMRVAQIEGDDFARLVAYALLGWMMIWPLVLYGLAAVTQIASRLLGGQGTPYGARLALFWSWLAVAPLGMLTGLMGGVTDSAAPANLCGALWIAVFAAFWWSSQREAARGPQAHGV